MTAKNQLSNRQQNNSSARSGTNVTVISAIWSHRHKTDLPHGVAPCANASARTFHMNGSYITHVLFLYTANNGLYDKHILQHAILLDITYKGHRV